MMRINLLPHREARRRMRRQQFFSVAGLMLLLGGVIGLGGHLFMSSQVSQQQERNRFIQSEISDLDRQIEDISRLRGQIDALLARKQVIESLQADRAQVVHLLNELVLRMPEGVNLQTMRQTNDRVTLVGRAQSNARVSHLMRNLDASPYLTRPGLVEVRSVSTAERRLSEFTLNIHLQRYIDNGASEAAE